MDGSDSAVIWGGTGPPVDSDIVADRLDKLTGDGSQSAPDEKTVSTGMAVLVRLHSHAYLIDHIGVLGRVLTFVSEHFQV